jgi:hypothetical protein
MRSLAGAGSASQLKQGSRTMAKKAAKRKAAGSSPKGSRKGQKRTASNKRAGTGARASARKGASRSRAVSARRASGRKTGGTKTSDKKKRTSATGRVKTRSLKALRKAGAKASVRAGKKTSPRRGPSTREGGTGIERELAQTPETGRSVRGPTNPMPTIRSTGTAAGAGNTRRAPGLERARRQLREVEETLPGPPSSLDMDRRPSAARSGRHELQEARREHTEVSPDLTAGDVDADWEDAYSVGDEAPGGDNPTPDQDRVDDIGKALGVQYEDNEELKASDKIAKRDKHRWELDPASSDDYKERD